MESTLGIALGITLIGMTLLFLALGLFYGLLALLTRVVRDRAARGEAVDQMPALESTAVQSEDTGAARHRAAVVAVALARAEAESAGSVLRGGEQRQAGVAGGWWAMHHGRRLAAPPSPWRGR